MYNLVMFKLNKWLPREVYITLIQKQFKRSTEMGGYLQSISDR